MMENLFGFDSQKWSEFIFVGVVASSSASIHAPRAFWSVHWHPGKGPRPSDSPWSAFHATPFGFCFAIGRIQWGGICQQKSFQPSKRSKNYSQPPNEGWAVSVLPDLWFSGHVSWVTTSEEYFFTSPKTCERSAVEASWRVVNMELVSFMVGLECWRENPCCLFDGARTYIVTWSSVNCKLYRASGLYLYMCWKMVVLQMVPFSFSATKNMIQTILPAQINFKNNRWLMMTFF